MALSKIKTGSVSDDLAVDTTTLVVDGTNNRVGVGTASPSSALHLSGAATADARQTFTQTTASLSSQIQQGSTGFAIAANGSQSMLLETNGTERVRIDSSGIVLVGKTVTDANTAGTVATQAGFFSVTRDGARPVIFNRKTSNGDMVELRKDNSKVGSISVTGSATSYNTSSDYRLKENVVELTGATARLKQLEPKRFNFIADEDTTVDGFLAHEVSDIVPEAITGTHNEVDEDGNPVYQGIDQSKLVPLLVATIKELEARIAALEGA